MADAGRGVNAEGEGREGTSVAEVVSGDDTWRRVSTPVVSDLRTDLPPPVSLRGITTCTGCSDIEGRAGRVGEPDPDANYRGTSTSSRPEHSSFSSTAAAEGSAEASRAETAQARDGMEAPEEPAGTGVDCGRLRTLSEVIQASELVEDPREWVPIPGHEGHFLDLSLLRVGTKFASGTYGQLFRGEYGARQVAVKLLKQPETEAEANAAQGQSMEQQCMQEVDMLSRLRHPNVLRFVGACKRPPSWCIVTEYMAGGDLRSFLSRREGQPLPLRQIVDLALCIAQGMEYLHGQGVVHRDLKPDNLLLDAEQRSVSIADFGVSRIESSGVMTAETGTYRWMAPEMIDHQAYDRMVDVYSFAIILWELHAMELPFKGMSAVQAAFAVINKGARPPLRNSCPPPLASLIQDCWQTDPRRRPGFDQVARRLQDMAAELHSYPAALDGPARPAGQTPKPMDSGRDGNPSCCTIL